MSMNNSNDTIGNRTRNLKCHCGLPYCCSCCRGFYFLCAGTTLNRSVKFKAWTSQIQSRKANHTTQTNKPTLYAVVPPRDQNRRKIDRQLNPILVTSWKRIYVRCKGKGGGVRHAGCISVKKWWTGCPAVCEQHPRDQIDWWLCLVGLTGRLLHMAAGHDRQPIDSQPALCASVRV